MSRPSIAGRDRRLPALLLALLVALFSISTWFVTPGDGEEQGVRSLQGGGRRALFLLLSSWDFEAVVRRGRPGLLPHDRSLVWVERFRVGELPEALHPKPVHPDAAEPSPDEPLPITGAPGGSAPEGPAEGLGDRPLREALGRGLSSPRHYRRFVEDGGSLLVEVDSTESLRRLSSECGFVEIERLAMESLARSSAAGLDERVVLWDEGESLTLGDLPTARFVATEEVRDGRVLVSNVAGDVLALEAPVGRGSLIVLACGELFQNQALAQGDNAVLAVRLAEHGTRHTGGSPRRTVRIDESGGLGEDSPSILDFALDARALPFTTALLLFSLLALWRALAAREIPREPTRDEYLSPRTRALGRARLYLRARRHDLLAQELRQACAREIAGTLRLAPQLAAAAVGSEPAARDFLRLALPGLPAEELPSLARALSVDPVRDGRDLARLDLQLKRLCERCTHVPRARARRAAPGPRLPLAP